MPTTLLTQEFILALKEQDKVDFIKTLITQFAPSMSTADAAKLANITISSPVNLNVMLTDIAGKVDKVAGKDLSEEDFTTALKTKLSTMEGSHFKGVHTTLALLETANPAAGAEDGSYAYVKASPTDAEVMVMLDAGVWVEQSSGGAGVAMTGAQIKALYEAEADTNVFDDAEKLKLDNAEKVFAGTHADLAALELAFPAALAVNGSYAYLNNSIDPQSFAMLSGGAWVEVGAGGGTATPTSAEIKTLYELNGDTNAYTDAEKLKLSTLEGSHFKGAHPDEAALLLAHPTA
ncbi:hypothetical protein J7J63_05890, partial [Candidatus Bipolaricaulota bacterium]|nr:hypothetical protein [Candidatus Bipolaricaulota bacterium]